MIRSLPDGKRRMTRTPSGARSSGIAALGTATAGTQSSRSNVWLYLTVKVRSRTPSPSGSRSVSRFSL